MARRGPDGDGTWIAENGRVGLAHRRLAIIDLSDAAAQPMTYEAGGEKGLLRIVYNGEIYNYRQLREELIAQGRRFRTESDTEVLLHLYDRDGAEMVKRLRGMFAFAIWEDGRRRLFLARDPFGIKPLYWTNAGGTFRAASQVKALMAGGAIDDAPDPAGHVGFFLFGYVPSTRTLYKAIRSLAPGTTLTVRADGKVRRMRYFDIGDELAEAAERPTPADAADALHAALFDSVKSHLVADVPVGVFLSAGLDSATVLALAAEAAESPLDSFTLGFDEFAGTKQDELPLAGEIAAHYGTHHGAERVAGSAFHEARDAVTAAMDQPSIDGVNSYFVARAAAARGLKVALSGIGGDELFAGYNTFTQVPALVRLGAIPGLRTLGQGFRTVAAPLAKALTSPKYAGVLEYASTYGAAYLLRRGLFMPWELTEVLDPDFAAAGWRALEPVIRLDETADATGDDPRDRVTALEMTWYLAGQLLRDADWAGMAHSLEIRTPLVDAWLFRAVAGLGATKQQMAATPRNSLPDAVLKRAKTGFAVPVHDWVAGEAGGARSAKRGLRGWARLVYAAQTGGI
jgi:asparagine synthase (glutamine-hydrolysing)